MPMSYPRDLGLVWELNSQSRAPLRETFQGGPKRGSTKLSEDGFEF